MNRDEDTVGQKVARKQLMLDWAHLSDQFMSCESQGCKRNFETHKKQKSFLPAE